MREFNSIAITNYVYGDWMGFIVIESDLTYQCSSSSIPRNGLEDHNDLNALKHCVYCTASSEISL